MISLVSLTHIASAFLPFFFLFLFFCNDDKDGGSDGGNGDGDGGDDGGVGGGDGGNGGGGGVDDSSKLRGEHAHAGNGGGNFLR